MNSDPPIGKRFSQVYLQRSDLLRDSNRMRRRLGTLFGKFGQLSRLGQKVTAELGISIGSQHGYENYWPLYLEKIELRDVLDLVTLRFKTIVDFDGTPVVEKQRVYLDEVSRLFAEEQVGYRVDEKGGVHLHIDTDFENLRTSTIGSLSSSRYQSARELFESAFIALDGTPPDGKSAIRSTFFATENLFRLMFPSAHQLSAPEVNKHLKPLIDKIYGGQKPAIYLAQKLVSALCDWIDGAHFYRHEPGSEEPAQPPLELAVYLITEAGGHLRWLAQIDHAARLSG